MSVSAQTHIQKRPKIPEFATFFLWHVIGEGRVAMNNTVSKRHITLVLGILVALFILLGLLTQNLTLTDNGESRSKPALRTILKTDKVLLPLSAFWERF